ncbi:MAG: MFS transporter [Chloroflexi bacterium]|nr:MFS transporter [Chloroflexota bacterium]
MGRAGADSSLAGDDADFPRWRRSVAVIALGACMASFSMNFWVPFLPVYMKKLGAADDAAALTWVGLAYTGSGVARLVSGPLWGVLSDRYGRKKMFIRALVAATLTTLIAAAATEPWHVAVAWASQGFFSGFIPAAVALTSVSVARDRLTSALGSVQGAQYAGNTVGPVIGAALAATLGLRGAVIAGALVPLAAAVIVALAVPVDTVRAPVSVPKIDAGRRDRGRWLVTITGGLSVQLGLGLLVFFVIHMSGGLVRTSAPVVIERLARTASTTGITGWTFAAGGLASAVGAVGLARVPRAPGRLRVALSAVIMLAAVSSVLLGLAGSVWTFGAVYALSGLCQGAMLPATNTIIASAVPYERRGAAFGLASSVQALAFVAGPLSAAYFASVSFRAGFLLLGLTTAAVGILIAVALREPALEEGRAPSRRKAEAARNA